MNRGNAGRIGGSCISNCPLNWRFPKEVGTEVPESLSNFETKLQAQRKSMQDCCAR